MASSADSISMALFCDFENVALGVRDANYEKFDIKRVLERLLLKGSIVVKKAYCDWDRYKSFKASMHEANFELIEIPHVRQSGKNSADIRLVVDALDLCYTKSHVDTFVIISGDSDFSPLVSKLRENAKQVIGVGVKQSTSDLLIANCDEFIFYDDLVRDGQRTSRRESRDAQPSARRSPEEEKRRKEELESRRAQAIEIAVETFDALMSERGDSGKIWASMLKEAIKRRKPDFSESYFGFRAFGNLLEEAQARGLLVVGRDEKSGTYVSRPSGVSLSGTDQSAMIESVLPTAVIEAPSGPSVVEAEVKSVESKPEAVEGTRIAAGRKNGRGRGTEGRKAKVADEVAVSPVIEPSAPSVDKTVEGSAPHEAQPVETRVVVDAGADTSEAEARPKGRRPAKSVNGRSRSSARGRKAEANTDAAPPASTPPAEPVIVTIASGDSAPEAAAKKPATRRRTRKSAEGGDEGR